MGKVNTPDLSIIILAYKSKPDLKRLLPSVFESKGLDFVAQGRTLPQGPTGQAEGLRNTAEIIVVDNGSNDGTVEYIGDLALSTKHLALIKSTNIGFAAGNNLGIKQAAGKYILLLNPDTKLEPDTLQTMLEFMEQHQEVGISGCKVIKADGKLDLACRRRFPNPWNSFRRLFLRDNENYNYAGADENLSIEVDSVMGAFLLIRKSVIDKIGLLDENFFMYGEDLDWCWRCKEAGFKVWYYPKTFITHYKGSSSRQIPFEALKWFHQAMWVFYKKHYYQKYSLLFSWLVAFGIYFRLCLLTFVNFFKTNRIVSK